MSDSEEDYSGDEMEEPNDEAEFLKNAIKQIEEQNNKDGLGAKIDGNNNQLKDLKVTTEGITQDQAKHVNLQKVAGLTQCYWCMTYHFNDMIVHEQGDCVCKHCFFCVNYTGSEQERLKFDKECCSKKGQGIATYILECYEEHKPEKCTRKPSCFLCDYKQGKQIKGIVNPDMLGICNDHNKSTNNVQHDDQDTSKNYDVDSADYIEMHENIMFCGGMDSKVKFKIPKKLVL